MLRYIHILAILAHSVLSYAGGGFWFPSSESQLKVSEEGCPDSISNTSSKIDIQPVVHLNTGCTGTILSPEGLILTNQHCLERFIPQLKDADSIIANGFYATKQTEEVLINGLTVTMTKQSIDISDSIVPSIKNISSYREKARLKDSLVKRLEQHYQALTGNKAKVSENLSLNQFQLIITETFSNVSLVFYPPEYINFGRKADNWEWPRHAADFAFIRIAPNTPKTDSSTYSFPYANISSTPIKEYDPVYILGFPTKSEQYLTSAGMLEVQKKIIPQKQAIYNALYNSYKTASKHSNERAVKFSGKLSHSLNMKQKYDGVDIMLKRFDAISHKAEHEALLSSKDSETKTFIEKLKIEEIKLLQYEAVNTCLLKILTASDMLLLTIKFRKLNTPGIDIDKEKTRLKNMSSAVISQSYVPVDSSIAQELIHLYCENFPQYMPENFKSMNKIQKTEYIASAFSKTNLTNSSKTKRYIDGFKTHKVTNSLEKDPLYVLGNSFYDVYKFTIESQYYRQKEVVDSLKNIFFKKSIELLNKNIYPDANATLRLSSGNIRGSEPRDGVVNNWYTTKEGILEKSNTSNINYTIPTDFKTFLNNSSVSDKVCYTTTCHTSGGNSGSPLYNCNHEVIGLNFDRTWQSTMSDYYYNPEICRNIVVDIHYITDLMKNYFETNRILEEIRFK